MATNPYAAPQARVADVPVHAEDGTFVPEGQSVAAGRAWDWITEGWRLFRASPALWIGVAAVILVGYAAIGLLPFGQVVYMLIGPVVGGGLLIGCRTLDQGGELAFGHLVEGFRIPQTGRLVTIGAIALGVTVALVAVVFAIIWATVGFAAFGRAGGGFMMIGLLAALLVMAVSVPLYMALWFAPALVTFEDYAPAEALKASFRACLKNVLPFLLYGLLLMLGTVVALVPLGLGLLVLTPVVIASVYAAYRDIFFIR
jgi:uncharacterized membrane protein